MKLRNKWQYRNNEDRWDWQAFLDDGGTGELANVDFVDYVLHPTFAKPIRRVDDSADGFMLRTNGWGSFELAAFVHTKDGKVEKLTHEVELLREPTAGES